MKHTTDLSKAEKVMLVLFEMSKGTKQSLRYEDIVVAAFNKFPEDFHLRGYDEFPDSGDLVHKPLYEFRKKGMVEANNKVFSLTERGMAFAERLNSTGSGEDKASKGRLSRFAEKEISRIESSEAFTLFLSETTDKLTDSDFYGYLGVTPRTSRNDFIGRLETIKAAIRELGEQKKLIESRKRIAAYHAYMTERFSPIIRNFETHK